MRLSSWLKNEGDINEPIVELETDKVNLEVKNFKKNKFKRWFKC